MSKFWAQAPPGVKTLAPLTKILDPPTEILQVKGTEDPKAHWLAAWSLISVLGIFHHNGQQVRFVSVKAERPNHPSRDNARRGVVVGGGGVLHDNDSTLTPQGSRLTVALGLKSRGHFTVQVRVLEEEPSLLCEEVL